MFHDPSECQKDSDTTKRAPVFRITHLISLHNVCQVKRDPYTMRGWTYILLSCSLFLRKSEAAALMNSDIDVHTNQVTGEVMLEDGLPRFLYIRIRRSKTDQEGQGTQIMQTCSGIVRISWCYEYRSAATVKKEPPQLQVMPCVNSYDVAGNIEVYFSFVL